MNPDRTHWEPGRLWGLLEMMELNAQIYVDIQSILTQMHFVLQSGEMRLDIAKRRQLAQSVLPDLRLLIADMGNYSEFRMAVMAANRLAESIEADVAIAQIWHEVNGLRDRLLD